MASSMNQVNPERRSNWRVALLLAWLAIISGGTSAIFAAGEEGKMGEVEMIVRGPDGRGLGGARVLVTPAARPSDAGKSREIAAQADGEGRARFQWGTGVVRQMDVKVEGVGYGYVGATEILADKPAKVNLPPLVAYATVTGFMPLELATPRAVVKFQSRTNSYDEDLVIPFVADGRFSASVRMGKWHVVAMDGNTLLAESPEDISLVPGQVLKNLTLKKAAEVEIKPQPRVAPAQANGPWAKGTVRDEAGKPVNGASVFLVGVYSTGMRMFEAAAKATTDAAGHYEIAAEGNRPLVSATVVASLPNRPPAWSWVHPASPAAKGETQKPAPDVDLVVPSKGGSLEITVRREGQPVTGVSVIAWLEGVDLRDSWAAGSTDNERREVEDIVHPVKAVNGAGVARFDNLLPGQYRIVAAVGDVARVRDIQDSSLWETLDPYAITEGVSVKVGAVTNYRMNIFTQGHRVPMKVTRGDKKPLTTTNTVFEYTSPAVGEWARSVEQKPNDVLQGMFEAPGLHRISFKYRDSGVGTMRVGDEPYYEAAGYVGASHLLEIKAKIPAKFTVMRYDPGNIAVELRDANGQRVRGVVELDEVAGRRAFAGSTDASGMIRFEGVPTWKYITRTFINGTAQVDLGSGDAPLSTADALTGRSAVLPQIIEVSPNTERQISLKAEMVGYVLGTVKPAAGHTAAEYSVAAMSGDEMMPVHYRGSTGEFVAGPFAAGKVRVSVWPATGNPRELIGQDVTIEAGKVARVELTAPAPDAATGGNVTPKPGSRVPWSSGVVMQMSGRVLQSDGKTPALGARVMLLGPPDAEPLLSGLTDARGTIHYRVLPRTQRTDVGTMKQSAIVAWLPGTSGAVIKPIPGTAADSLELVLPPPTKLQGKVTIAGLPPQGRNEKIRIMTGNLDHPELSDVLNVQTIAQPDGTFELSGLTPGKYEVQAAYDDIWLSESAAITVGNTPLQPISLNVGTPGGPLTVRVVGRGGRPIPARQVTIDRPKGPLAKLLWPAEFVTDGAGEVWIPALEAGQHTVHVPRTNRSGEATVIALPVDIAVALQIQIDEKTNP